VSQSRLRVMFCDHLNLARGKYLPAEKASDGEARFCQSTFAVTYDKDLIPSPGSKMLEGLPDMIARFDEDEVRPDWQANSSIVVSDLFESDGTPLPMCGRSLLKRTVAEWQTMGYQPKIGIELEAYAFMTTEGGQVEPLETPGAYVYSTGPFPDPSGFTDAIWERAHEAGFKLEMITSEFDSPQFEFTLQYDDAVKAVDDIFLFRLMARETALEYGVLLTFVPKAFEEKGGSGFHVNFSFADNDGNNVIGDPSAEHGLSDLAHGCIAGLAHHHRGMAALLAPSVNSYSRLQPASLSGYWANWANDHRGVTTRVSTESVERSRIEHRMADGTGNPYTIVATVLQAARLGVVNSYTLPAAETGDCFEKTDATVGVADNLGGALDDLENDTVLTAAVGKTLVDNLVFIKRDEIEKTALLEGQSLRDYYIHYI
jgi:glutamine synthetase